MCNYVGITIGPIFENILDASNPASLWFASSVFSDITKRLCESLTIAFQGEELKIYSPYYEGHSEQNDGIGKYHDRIIFSVEVEDSTILSNRLNTLICDVKQKTAEVFPDEIRGEASFFEKYLQIKYVILDEISENCVLALSPYLDALELMVDCNEYKNNPFYELFTNSKSNALIKNSKLMPAISKLRDSDGSIYSIKEIANSIHRTKADVSRELKYRSYFAIVSADGDGMGNFLKSINSDTVTVFSSACLRYASKVCDKISEFGGMPIYAGGDDLLFLAPVVNEKNENIFRLCKTISDSFIEEMKKMPELNGNENLPTVSFGIAIQYIKMPLYEAFAHSRKLLEQAKSIERELDIQRKQKNCMAIGVSKHSGQSFDLIVGNESVEAFSELLAGKGLNDSNAIQSVLYTLAEFRPLLTKLEQVAANVDAYMSGFMNLFDNAGQKTAEPYLKTLAKIYYEEILHGTMRIYSSVPTKDNMSETEIRKDNYWGLINILKLSKFFKEEKGDKD